MTPQPLHTLIIGGGIAGLACAHRLVRELGPGRVRLLEASDYLGGHVRTTHEVGYQLDWGPNGFLDREPAMLDWVRELGLEGELIQANQAAARRFLLLDGRLVELVGPPKFLLAPLLSVKGRVRLMREPFIPPKRDGAPESVYDFAARRIGREAADTLVSAMVLGIFGGDAKQLSLQHCFPRMAAMEREHGSLFKAMLAKQRAAREAGGSRSRATAGGPTGPGGTLTSLRGGIGRLAERAAEVLGDICRTGAYASTIRRDSKTFIVPLNDGELVRAENVVLATPANTLAYLLKKFHPLASDAFASIEYVSVVVVCAGFRKQKGFHNLDGFGFLIPPKEGYTTMGSLWTSSIFPDTAPDGSILLRTMMGGAFHPNICDKNDAALYEILRSEVLEKIGVHGAPEILRVFRKFKAIPQYGLNHAAVLSAADAAEHAHPGLYFTGSALRGVAMIDCVTDAFRTADRILKADQG